MVISSMMGKAAKKVKGSIGMPKRKPNAKTIMPWRNAAVLSPNIFPKKMVNRETGATKISFMNPNSLSQITLIPMNMAVKSSVCPIMPGKSTAGSLPLE